MAVATGLTTLANGNTIDAAELNSNYTILKNSVNNVVADQITDGVITNAEISSTAEIAMSKITATASDAKLSDAMENFISGCYIYRVDGDNIGITVGSMMINGELRRLTSAITNATYSAPDNADWLDVWALADSAASTFTLSIVDSGTAPGGSANPGTNGRMVGSINYIDGTSKIADTIQYRDGVIMGWTQKVGSTNEIIAMAVTHGKTFDDIPSVVTSSYCGRTTTGPSTDLSGMVTYPRAVLTAIVAVTTTGFTAQLENETGTNFAGTDHHTISYALYGSYS